MSPKLSVVIPVHNGSKKIEKTAKQILNQDYDNLELILVENGSTDDTFKVCKSIEAQDKRCVALQSNVKSTLIARKTGIDYATGDYITFCDADDTYRGKDSLRKMVEAIEETKADIVQFGNIVNRFGRKDPRLNVKEKLIIDRQTLLSEEIAGAMGAYGQIINLNVWAKIYRSGVLKNVSADLVYPMINAEDLFLNVCAFFSDETRKVAFVPICEYVYNTGIGVSGDGVESVEKMLHEYQYFKMKALELADKYGVGEKPVYLCQRETLRFLDGMIKSYIERGDTREAVCNKIQERWNYEFIQVAKTYFIEYMKTHELDEEMKRFSTETDPERYYDYCIQRMGNVTKARIKYKAKHIVKSTLRWLDRI